MDLDTIKQRLKAYTKVDISLDLKLLSDNQKRTIENLIDAGKIADHIFWRQTSHDASGIREQYKNNPGLLKDYIEINYGPYDRLHNFERFVGEGPDYKPLGAGFYPEDLSQEQFNEYINQNPGDKDIFEDLYTVISREENKLEADHYHQIYHQEIQQITNHLEEAASFTQNNSLRSYFQKRSQALKTDQYYESDIAWMDLKDNLIDIVIGPIENYEDRLFNYKTSYEAAVMIKDITASNELEIYKKHLNNLEQNLPMDDSYKNVVQSSGNILEIVNIAYFGGDYQAGVKTIAASLPNDEKVISEKGAKKQLYKNIMEAKFDQILVPIADHLIDSTQKSLLSKERFISQVLLHEISHTIGPNYVVGNSKTVRKSLRERYSVIEECKADILGIYAVPYFASIFSSKKEDISEHYITYSAGLFRSIRFGVDEAHGMANLIQLNFLAQNKVISIENQTGKYSVNTDIFHRVVKELAGILLVIEAHGDYDQALKFIDTYGQLTSETRDAIERLNEIPTDLDLRFNPDL
jgi:peptide methionine sulfoxide reductase MsrA